MEDRAGLSDVQNAYVYSLTSNQRVPLRQVSNVTTEMAVSKIKRRNQFRTVTVSTFPIPGVLPSQVLAPLLPKIKEFQKNLPPGYFLEIGGEYDEQQKGFKQLGVVMAISVLLIYIALVMQFKNAVKPFLVFAAIPYGMTGAFAGLVIMGQPFGFMGFLGVASLVGVIVSHVIVLFDFIEEAHERGEPLREALLDAGHRATATRDDHGRCDCARTHTAGHARGTPLGTSLLRPDWWSDDRDLCDPAARPGDLLDLCVGSEADYVGISCSSRADASSRTDDRRF